MALEYRDAVFVRTQGSQSLVWVPTQAIVTLPPPELFRASLVILLSHTVP